MKTRGAWGNAVKFIGVVALVCGLLFLIILGGAGKHVLPGKASNTTAAAIGAGTPLAAKETSRWTEAYGTLPLSFEENQGQTAREVRYASHGSGYELFLTPQEAVIALRRNPHSNLSPLHRKTTIQAMREAHKTGQIAAVRMQLEGANPNPTVTGLDQLPGKANYFIGNDPKKWHTDVPSFARVKYASVYPGVDVVFYGNQRRLEYDFIVAPGADPRTIQLKIDGARKMHIDSHGDLVLGVPGGEVELQKPLIYQQVKGERREIAGNYLLTADHRVTFSVATYDRNEPLILDPVLNYSTYLGGSGTENGQAFAGIAVDKNGNAFVTGQTTSIDFPSGTNGGVSAAANPNSGAVFVAEIDPTGTKLLYSTYLRGTTTNSFETGTGIAVDSTGKVYVTGVTFAIDFPTTSNAFNAGPLASNIPGTAFVAKLDPTQSGKTNSLLYSTYLRGTGGDTGNAIAVDGSGNAYVAGFTNSTDFPTQNPFQSALATGNTSGSAFLARIDTTKASSTLIYSTYLGGNGLHSATSLTGHGDEAFGVAVDASNVAYVAGTTSSTNFPTNGSGGAAFQPTPPAPNITEAVFVSKVDTTKTGNPSPSLIYSTYLAGSTGDFGNAVALGPNNVIYVTGTTNSTDFPTTVGAFDASGNANGKAFISLVDTSKSGAATLKYSTFLGGTNSNTGFGIQADASGNAYVGGSTASADFPFPPKSAGTGGFEPTFPAGARGVGFIAKLNPAGGGLSDLLYSTFFGGIGTAASPDQLFAIAIDGASPPNVYVTGQTFSTAATFPIFPTTAPTAFQTALNGTSDAFVAKLALIPTLAIAPAPGTTLDFGTILIGNTSAAQTVTLTNNTNGPISFTGAVLSGTNAADYTVTTAACTGGIVVGTPCVVSVKFKPTVVAPPSEVATLTITDGDSTSPQVFSLTGKGSNAPPDFTLSAAPAAENVAQGAVGAPVTITVNPTNGFASAVALTCTGAPANSICALSPASITPPTTSSLTFTAHAMLMPLPISKPAPPLNMLRIVPLFVAVMILFLLRSAQRFRTRLALVTAICFCVTIAACSGPMTGPIKTNKGNYPLTVTGTSGALSHNTTVTITVN